MCNLPPRESGTVTLTAEQAKRLLVFIATADGIHDAIEQQMGHKHAGYVRARQAVADINLGGDK